MTARPDRLEVSELFESLQGEGPSLGAPCLFVRLGSCNLRCTWCDTPYTWDWTRHQRERELTTLSLAEVGARLLTAPGRRVVITGGEPLIQREALAALLAEAPAELTIEVETNGTLSPGPALAARVDQWNVSPKLAHSGESVARRLRVPALLELRDTGRAFLKVVVRRGSDDDLTELDALVRELDWPPERVLLMPEAATREALAAASPLVAAAALVRGHRFSTRLHVELWGGRRGV